MIGGPLPSASPRFFACAFFFPRIIQPSIKGFPRRAIEETEENERFPGALT